jgi:hypothetical protein
MSLSDDDRQIVARAAQLGPALRASSSDRDRLAGWLLAEMAAIIERLDVPPALVVTWCKGCQSGTTSVMCGKCGRPMGACANCGRCPDCDGEITEASHG